MKRIVGGSLAVLAVMTSMQTVLAQTPLNDQNPNYLTSQNKYMKMADSLNRWHSSTIQQTYKAIDYLEDKKADKEERKAFRQERARNRWYNDNNYYGYNNYGYNYNYYPNRYSPYYGHRNNYYPSAYSYRNNPLWNVFPTALTLGLLYR